MASGRTEKENEAFNFVKTLANYRKNSDALTMGKLTQFIPYDGLYVYFRHTADKTLMIVMSQNKEDKNLDTQRFAERMTGFTTAKSVLSGETISDLKTIKITANSFNLFELK